MDLPTRQGRARWAAHSGRSLISNAVSDASRDFKSAVASMRLIVKDFTASPDDTLIARFEQAHALALKGLDALAETIDHVHAETIANLRKDVLDCAKISTI